MVMMRSHFAPKGLDESASLSSGTLKAARSGQFKIGQFWRFILGIFLFFVNIFICQSVASSSNFDEVDVI